MTRQRGLLAAVRVGCSELPGDRGGGGDLDDRVQPEADQRGGGGDGARGDGDDCFDDVVGDGRRHEQPDPAMKHMLALRGRC